MLELSHTATYAILALACLEEAEGRWTLAKEITGRTGIATPYLSKILHSLRISGLICAKRGYRGGFRLARPAASITLLEVIEAADKRVWTAGCLLGLEECSEERACPLHPVWTNVRTRIEQALEGVNLAAVTALERDGSRRLTHRSPPRKVRSAKASRKKPLRPHVGEESGRLS